MKCVVDLGLLNPAPPVGSPQFAGMLLHWHKLAESGLKIALSPELRSSMWQHWKEVKHRQYQRVLVDVLGRFCASCFPKELEVDGDKVSLDPVFVSGEPEWVDPWLCSLMACYLDEDFNTGGAFIATWARADLAGRRIARVTYYDRVEEPFLVRSDGEWDALVATLSQLPLAFSERLRAYVDEGGRPGSDVWIAVVVASEQCVNQVSSSAIAAYNEHRPRSCAGICDIHFRRLHVEQERRLLARLIVAEICAAGAVCFVAPRKSSDDHIGLFSRIVGDVLEVWHPDLIWPVYIDTPFDREGCEVKNRELRARVHNAVHSKGFDCRSDGVVLGKSRDYPGLGLADAIAYFYLRRSDAFWQDLWQRLINEKRIVLI